MSSQVFLKIILFCNENLQLDSSFAIFTPSISFLTHFPWGLQYSTEPYSDICIPSKSSHSSLHVVPEHCAVTENLLSSKVVPGINLPERTSHPIHEIFWISLTLSSISPIVSWHLLWHLPLPMSFLTVPIAQWTSIHLFSDNSST